MCGIVTHLLLSVVDCRRLTDDCKVTSGADRKRMTYDFIAEELCVLLLKSQTVILVILLPVFQLDDQIDLLLLLDSLDTEQRLHVNDADSAQLDKVTCDVR